MNPEKYAGKVLRGFAWGGFAGVVLWIPSCILTGLTKGSENHPEYAANIIFWLCVVGGGILAFVITAIEESKKDQAERQRIRREVDAGVAAHKEAQQNFETELVNVTETSLKTFESLPNHLLEAEFLLDQAETDFKEEAFAPFWDAIEQAATRLGCFDSGITSINQSLRRYGELSALYELTPPRFPIVIESVKGMVAGNTTADRMKVIVRQAQRNFQFALIYEQRKTNQILVAGFTNLAQALDGMGRKVSESIDALRGQVSELSSSLESSFASLGEHMAAVNQGVSELNSTVLDEAKSRSDRHDRALEMLDNIQRRRMPTGFYVNLGTKPAP